MKICIINTFDFGSTGNIMLNIAHVARNQGMEVHTYSSHYAQKKKACTIGHTKFDYIIEMLAGIVLGRITGLDGLQSFFSTRKLIGKIKKISPDIIHLHNIHGYLFNLPMLFKYIKKRKIKVVWTLHDCWTMTGRCPYYTLTKCNKWETQCDSCIYDKSFYPAAHLDTTRIMHKLKKKWFTGVNDLTIVTPSRWLCDLVKQSYLKDYPVKVINNGIDLNVFKPTESDFRAKYGLEDKYIVLGVASAWGKRKGLDVFIELAKRLDDKYKIVLVGLSKEQIASLPENIIGIERTQNQKELAEIYSAADVFANPTREDNFPTVNIESIACGTPVVTFKTGGSPEMLDETCGSVVECDDVLAMQREIERICTQKPYSIDACVKRAGYFNKDDKFMEYVKEYEKNIQYF